MSTQSGPSGCLEKRAGLLNTPLLQCTTQACEHADWRVSKHRQLCHLYFQGMFYFLGMFSVYKTTRPGPHRGQELLHGNGTTGSPLGTGPSRTELYGKRYLFGDSFPTKGTEPKDFLCPTNPRSTQELLYDWGPTNVHLFNSTMTFREGNDWPTVRGTWHAMGPML